MGLTVENVIERAYEEILEAGGTARPAWDVLEGAIDASTLTIVLEGRQTYVPPDGLLEFWDSSMEVVEVKSTSSSTVTGQTRGYLGTTAAIHSDGAKVVLDNPYPRYVLLNGLKAVIDQLRGYGLYQEAFTSSLTYNTTAPVELPTGAKDVIDILSQNGSNWLPLAKGTSYRVFYNFTGVNTAPAIQFFGGGIQGAAMKVRYKKEFTTSTFALTTDLETTVGIPSTLAPHLPTGLAGHILMGRDVPMLEAEYIRPDPQNPTQIGTKMNVGRALWTSFISGPVQAERVRNLETNPTVITYDRVW